MLAELFAAYKPSVVLVRPRAATPHGVRSWWLAFYTKESLDEFAAGVHGSIVDGKELAVEPVVALWTTEPFKQRQIEEVESLRDLRAQRATTDHVASQDLGFSWDT
jgi:hypothetical protein